MAKQLSTKFLVLVLLLITLQAVGTAFIYDFPQIFEAVLIQRMGIDAYKVQVLYTIASAPNLVSNLIASIFLPKVGVGFIVMIFHFFTFAGAGLTYLAIRMNSYYFLCFGRVFVGLSFDLCILGGILSCEKWFRGKILSISLGLTRFVRLLGSSASFYFLPKIFLRTRNLEDSAFCCVVVAFVIFSTTSIFAVLDIQYEDHLKESSKKQENGDKLTQKNENQEDDDNLLGSKIVSVASEIKEKEFTFKHFKYISPMAWFFVCYAIMTPSLYNQVSSTGSDFLVTRYRMSYKDAKNILSLLPLVSAFLIPLWTVLYTKFGNKSLGILLASIFSLASYSSFAFLRIKSGSLTVLPLVLLAIYYSLNYGTMWSSLLLSVPKQASSRFLGITITFQNMLYATLPLVTARIYRFRTVEGYQNWLYFMMGYSAIAVTLASMVFFFDIRGNKVLMLPENDKRVVKIQKQMSSNFQNSVLNQSDKKTSKAPETEYATLGGGTSKSWRSGIRSQAQTNLSELKKRQNEGEEDDLPNKNLIKGKKTNSQDSLIQIGTEEMKVNKAMKNEIKDFIYKSK